MATKKPLCLYAGDIKEIQSGDDLGITGGGLSLKGTITQSSHGFVAGNVLYFNGTIWAKAKADAAATADAVCVVESVTDSNNFIAVLAGAITLSGLSVGANFLSDATAGLITTTEPAYPSISKPILFATSATQGYVQIERGFSISIGAATISISPWATGQDYTVDQTVYQSDKIYRCAVAHTSGTFATDLAAVKWVELSASSGGGTWGSITGTLSSQTDLNSALAGKAASTHTHAQSDITNLTTDLSAKAAIGSSNTFTASQTIGNSGSDVALNLGVSGARNGYLNSADWLLVNIDSDNSGTGTKFVIGTNRAANVGGIDLFIVSDDGSIWAGSTMIVGTDTKIPIAAISATGTPDSTKALYGDGVWRAPSAAASIGYEAVFLLMGA